MKGETVTVLAADVGGTHARLALFDVEWNEDGGRRRPTLVREDEWPSEEHEGLLPIVQAFLEDEDELPGAACLAVAGPVRDGTCRLPNLGWEVQAGALSGQTSIEPLRLVNDFDAIARGVLLLRDDELAVLSPGGQDGGGSDGAGSAEDRATRRGRSGGMVAVVGAGTGLGVAGLEPDVDPPRIHGSEGGHAAFASVTEEERALARFLAERHGRASWERVLSGDGLVDVYRHLVERGAMDESPWVRQEMDDEDPAAVVSRHGLAGDDLFCEEALRVFVEAYGRFAGDVALTLGARAGVYVAGGIAPQILDALRGGRFLDAFRRKGRMSDYMARIPVQVVLNQDVGLLGSAALAGELVTPGP
jgi:glucokinase